MMSFSGARDREWLYGRVAAGVLGVLLLYRVAVLFSYAPELMGIDNNFVYAVTRGLAGATIYPNPEAFPFAINVYAPLYFHLCILAGKLTGTGADDGIRIYWLCRGVALLCDIASCLLLYRILARGLGLRRAPALLAVAGFAAALCYLAYTFSRADALFLTAYIALVSILVRGPRPGFARSVLLPAALCVACIFAKQNGIIAPALTGLWFLFFQPRKTPAFVIAFLVLLAAAFLLWTQVFGYSYLLPSTVTGVRNRIDPSWFYTDIFKRLVNSQLLLPFVAGVVAAIVLARRDRTGRFWALCWAGQFLFSTALAFKWGSSLGYYYESLVLSLITGLLFLQSRPAAERAWIRRYSVLALPVLLVFTAHVLIEGSLYYIQQRAEKKQEYNEQVAVAHYLRQHLEGAHVFNLNAPNRDFFKVLLYRELAAPTFDTIDCCLLPDGNFDYTALKAELANGGVRFLILPKGTVPSSLWGVSLARFQKDTSIRTFDLYKFTAGPAPVR
ncbi:MAG: hypothetical protein EOO11_14920 [Chitinophagaceae bacterium]|nr:MAG: hypothetical protein EOO11_14920 [Chitinophagaceae bacterium]